MLSRNRNCHGLYVFLLQARHPWRLKSHPCDLVAKKHTNHDNSGDGPLASSLNLCNNGITIQIDIKHYLCHIINELLKVN